MTVAQPSGGPSVKVAADDKVPRLRHGQLGFMDLAGASFATMAPAYSLYTTGAGIVAGVALGSPLVVLFAGIAFLLHCNGSAQFSRKIPSAGSYTAFFGRTWGGPAGAGFTMAYVIALIPTGASVMIVPGWWTSVAIQALWGVNVSWWIPYIVINVVITILAVVGVKLSTRVAVTLFGIEMAILFAACAIALTLHPAAISAKGFSFGEIQNGFSGIAVSFPLAFYMFLGASNNVPLAEEANSPRKQLPLAIYSTTIIAIFIYAFMTWATGVGFNWNVHAYSTAPFPLVDAVQSHFGSWRFLLYFAGFTSTIALLITGRNGGGRIFFSTAREGMLPGKSLTRVHPRWHTPSVAIIFSTAFSFIVGAIVGGIYGPVNGFNWTASLGTLELILVFIAINVSLTVYYWREHRQEFSWLYHGVIPVVGSLALLIPVYSLVKPGAPLPYWAFPYVSILFIAIGVGYGIYMGVTRKDIRPGSVLADD